MLEKRSNLLTVRIEAHCFRTHQAYFWRKTHLNGQITVRCNDAQMTPKICKCKLNKTRDFQQSLPRPSHSPKNVLRGTLLNSAAAYFFRVSEPAAWAPLFHVEHLPAAAFSIQNALDRPLKTAKPVPCGPVGGR